MILDGKIIASKIYEKLRPEIAGLKEKNIAPGLGVILVGENPVSLSYVKEKAETARQLGIEFKLFQLPGMASENQVIELILDLNRNKHIHGIVVQLPLPKDFDRGKIIKTLDPKKDIDGFLGKIPAPTPSAILEILKHYNIDYKSKKICIIGRGFLVGAPLEKMLMAQGFEPLVCDSKTKNIERETRKADILISATGVPGLIKKNFIKDGVILIDAGTAKNNGKIIGDIDSSAYQKAKAYTPVPGGVGPVTVACLMRNLIEAAKKQLQ